MVVFDVAGTTVNENMLVYKTLQNAIEEAGFTVTLEQVLAEGAGMEKLDALRAILKKYTTNKEEDLVRDIYHRFVDLLKKAYDEHEILPQDNAVTLFEALRQKKIRVVLNTGYNRQTAQSLIAKLGWKQGETFDDLITAADVRQSRPHPDMIQLAMQRAGITDAREVAKVGDSVIDIEEGMNAGASLNIGITTGAHTREQLGTAKPDYIVDNLIEVLPLITEFL
jgi:phosphonatase-like hydrolase